MYPSEEWGQGQAAPAVSQPLQPLGGPGKALLIDPDFADS